MVRRYDFELTSDHLRIERRKINISATGFNTLLYLTFHLSNNLIFKHFIELESVAIYDWPIGLSTKSCSFSKIVCDILAEAIRLRF
jgi:hypothetical protein